MTQEIKIRALDLIKKGLSVSDVANQLQVHRTTVHRWTKEIDEKKTTKIKREDAIGGQVITHPKFIGVRSVAEAAATKSVQPLVAQIATKKSATHVAIHPKPVAHDFATDATDATDATHATDATDATHATHATDVARQQKRVATLKTQVITKSKVDSCNTFALPSATHATVATCVATASVASSIPWVQMLQAALLATFCFVATAFIIWESGEAQGGAAATVLAGLIEVGALGLAAVPLNGKQGWLKCFVLGLIGLYSVSLLCSASIAKSQHQKILLEESNKNNELNKQITVEKIKSNKAKEELLRDSMASKRMELEALLQKGYVGASRKLSGEISDLENKLLNLEVPQVAIGMLQSSETLVFAGVFWLCAGRAILVVLNFFAASLLHRFFKFQGGGI